MIRTDSSKEEEARALAQRVKREVNQRYKLLEIEQDGMFKCMLLLKKKKYAAIKLEHDSQGNLIEVTSSVPPPKTLHLIACIAGSKHGSKGKLLKVGQFIVREPP